MSEKPVLTFKSNVEFANFGRNAIAYVRKISAGDVQEVEDEFGPLPDDGDIWALYGADGLPIAISDDREMLISNANENDLVAVTRQ